MTIQEANDRLYKMLSTFWPLEDAYEIAQAFKRAKEITPIFTKDETKDALSNCARNEIGTIERIKSQ